MNKKDLVRILQKTPKKYWYLDFFKENKFKRKQCKKCGKFFWTTTNQDICNDSSCRPYEFIESPVTKKEFDYFSLWKKIKKFFESEGHTNVKRYPVLCKWFPDLYFTIAGVVDFYRKDGEKFVFELPANPVVILQPSLRFNDIPQVGVSGRHWTCHSHLEQASLYDGKNGYWKERCIELDYRMLTEILGIKQEKINFIEDAWLGPGAFGYSLEYHVGGLELGNAVFTEFRGTPDNYKTMNKKLIDMGAGFDRFVWISKRTPTNYDAVLGDVIEKMKNKASIKYDKKLFEKYAKLSGILNIDEVDDIKKAKKEVAKKVGISEEELEKNIEPIQAIYAIADHVQTLLFAISDGGIPSNIGGGYNLRVILRRALSFIEKYNLNIDIYWVADKIARHWKTLYPELLYNMNNFNKIISIEEQKYRESMENAKKIINNMIKRKEKITEEKMIELYDSKGITPELINEVGEKHEIKIEIPSDIYKKVTEKHEREKKSEKKYPIEKEKIKNIEETNPLFYENIYEFKAKVLKIIKNFVILDKTAFYPRGGGQEPDFGEINGCKVFNVEKVDKIILHQVDKINFKENDIVKCKVDESRRKQLTQHHTATHVINASCREVLGEHVWQEGSKKDTDKAHLDISHYRNLTEEEVEKIEKKANEIIRKDYVIKKEVLDRPVAEKRYGFRIYQGAAVPSKILRIISIDNIEHEACGGTHLNRTGEIEKIIILKTEKPHDGTVRLIYVAGNAANEYLKKCEKIIEEVKSIIKTDKKIIEQVSKKINEWKENRKKIEKLKEEIAEKNANELKFENIGKYKVLITEMKATLDELQKISLKISKDDTIIFLFGINEKVNIFASRGKKVNINIGNIVKEISHYLGGNGGGSPMIGQGFGLNIDKVGEAKKKIEEMLKNG